MDSPEQCTEIIRQTTAIPLEQHTVVTIDVWRRLEADITARAAGDGLSDAMVRQTRTFKNSPLGESPGEEFPRTSNTTKRRAAHVRLGWIMASIRHKRILYKCKSFTKKFGQLGRDVINAEWRLHKRVLQTKTKAKWCNANLSNSARYRRL